MFGPARTALAPAATRPGIVSFAEFSALRAKTSNCPGTPGAAQSAAIARLGSAASAASTQTTTQRGMAGTLRGPRVRIVTRTG